jgi:catechol 2,3-dioxygenase-like lactoylglutathione lyase family enzyme
MIALDELLDRYDHGRLSRRELLTGLALIGFTSAGAQAQPATPAVAGSTLNHLQLNVKDLEATRDFYAKLFGARLVRKDTPDNWHLDMAGSSISLRTSPDRQIVDHFGVGVARFDANAIEAAVKSRLPAANAQITADRTAVGVRDPNGILVQISSK